MSDAFDTRAAAREALQRGFRPVPIPPRQKNPGFKAWQDFQTTEDAVNRSFRHDGNLGLLLGAPSGNLFDVDLDCPETVRLADAFLPATGLVHGRPSKPRSHRFFLGEEPGSTEQFKDPVSKSMLVELRGQGGQTVIPPSVHPEGERLEWASYGEPARVRLADLRRDVGRLAAAAALVRYYPEGSRHEFTLALSGFLLRRGLPEQKVLELLLVVAEAVGADASRPEDLAHIRSNVRDTAKRLAAGRLSTGGLKLKEFLDAKILSKLVAWLGLSGVTQPGRVNDETDARSESGPNERTDDPHRIARLFLSAGYDHPDRPTLLFFREEFYRWTGTRYEVLPDATLRGEISQFAKAFFDEKNAEAVAAWEANGRVDPETGKPTRKPTCKTVTVSLTSNVRQALLGMVAIPADLEPPAWLGSSSGRPPAGEIVAFENQLLHIPAFAAGEGSFTLRHTPLFFSLNVLSFPFDPNAPAPEAWIAFLTQLWPDDPASIRELQKWFGYCLTADTSHQKILMLIGPPRSGKGTLARILILVLGPRNVAGPTLSSFATNFGLWPLLGKRLALISDARITGRTDSAPVIERLLSISGEDVLTVDRKNLPPVSSKLDARLMLLSNELPRLGDSSAALASRMVILGLTRSWLGKEDPRLTARLTPELPGILVHFALPGWRMLQEDGCFRQPGSGAELVEELESLSSPILAFVQEKCVEEPGASVEVQLLFAEWLRWCEAMHRENPGDCQTFGRNLRAALPHLRLERPRRGGERIRVYEGLRLRMPGEEWSATVRGHFNSTCSRDQEISSSTRVRDAIGGTADHRGPGAPSHTGFPCVTCGVEVGPNAVLCTGCMAAGHPRKGERPVEPSSCFVCHGSEFWPGASGQPICSRCHPRAPRRDA